MVNTPQFQHRGAGSIPGQGNGIPHVGQHGQKQTNKQESGIQQVLSVEFQMYLFYFLCRVHDTIAKHPLILKSFQGL